MALLRHAELPLLLFGIPLLAQQVKFIDLTTTPQRVELRYPPAAPNQHGNYSVGSVGDCVVDPRDPHSLTVTVQNAIVRDTDPKRPFEIEFKVLNTGQSPLRLPTWPHLSDLQPDDASTTFSYMSLTLSASPIEDGGSLGYIELYGKSDKPDTLITLKPGEWIRVEANVRFRVKLPPADTFNLKPDYWLRNVTFYPHPGGFSTDVSNICVNRNRPTPTIQVRRD
jgi:hypothetical protein